ncbi:putative molybdopterin synthase small subunit MoaD [Rhodococcus sp. AW25M09]|uniref:MoaD/ThiS family protein n=1 Tax=Rhodococcus sp. AW25M09 TaxID=1268303 RepID=UPI0002ACDEF0|nr:MoaD/ThiS family protein [Rhodococcus sp. AW25M09]CCQ17007.1 putative molybdopterin synthase small subunit MoaD [Rhodococcus sp. AW25M09]
MDDVQASGDAAPQTRVEVRYFAAAVDASGCDSEYVTVPTGATLAELRELIRSRHGAPMEPILRVSAYLVGDDLTRDLDRAIGSRVDVLPPFAGG